MKLADASGASLWSRQIGGSGAEEGSAVAVLPDGDVLVGGACGSADTTVDGASLPSVTTLTSYWLRLNAESGALVWSATDRSPSFSRVRALAVDDAGRGVIHGEHAGLDLLGCSTSVGTGGSDLFVARVDTASGRCVWLESLGGPDDERAGGVAVRDHRVYVTASINDGATLGSTTYTTEGDDAAGGNTDALVMALEL